MDIFEAFLCCGRQIQLGLLFTVAMPIQDGPFETHRPRIAASLHLQAAGIETAWPSRVISLSSSYICRRLIIGSGHMRALART